MPVRNAESDKANSGSALEGQMGVKLDFFDDLSSMFFFYFFINLGNRIVSLNQFSRRVCNFPYPFFWPVSSGTVRVAFLPLECICCCWCRLAGVHRYCGLARSSPTAACFGVGCWEDDAPLCGKDEEWKRVGSERVELVGEGDGDLCWNAWKEREREREREREQAEKHKEEGHLWENRPYHVWKWLRSAGLPSRKCWRAHFGVFLLWLM